MRRPVPFGKYLLLDRISVGGMAEVFKAKSFGVQGFEKVIAIKRILPSMGKDEDFIKMFIDEAKIAGQLAHANIGQIHELGQIEGAHFIAMEYIWGRDLLQLQNRFTKLGKRLSTTSSAFIVMKICEGLHYAHKKRDVLGSAMEIVHRDCSPQNVVVSYEGEVKLIDFGIARAASRSARTQAGVLKGKFGYMSPEQVRGLPLDRRSDIFSLGIILYECLTGERLFNGESDFSILEKVRNAEVDLQVLKDANIPPELEKVVLKALNRTPDDRYQWCADMRDDLRNFLQTTAEVYTYRSLGEEMRAAFGSELAREQELMDVYAKIGKGGISQELFEAAQVLVGGEESSIEGFESSNVARVRKAGLALGSQPRQATGSEDFEDHPTEIFGELGIDDIIGVSDDLGQGQPLISELGEIKVHVAEQNETGKPGAPADDGPLVSFVEKASAGVTPAGMAPIGHYARPVGASLPPPGRRAPYTRPRRATRDVLIGVSLALAMVTAFVVVKRIFFHSEAVNQAPRATLVVLVADKKAAEVYLGDQRVGTVPVGEALTVEELDPGSYAIRVAREGAVPCEATIEVDAERVKVFNCEFADGLPARLLLEDLRAADIVIVDGKVVPASSLKGGLALAAGRSHSIAVTRDGDLIDEFDLTLSDQEQFRHKVRPARSDAGPEGNEEIFEMTPDPIESEKVSERSGRDRSTGQDKPLRGTGALSNPGTSESSGQKSPQPQVGAGALQDPELEDPEDSKPSKVVTKDPVATHGYLTAWTRPWARVYVDGKDTGKVTPIAPAARIKLRAGKHKVSFLVGSKMHDFSVTIEGGQETKLAKILD